METIRNLINNKVTKIEKNRFLMNLDKLIKEGEIQKSKLFQINNHIKSKLLNCVNLNQVFNIKLELPEIPCRLTEKLDVNFIHFKDVKVVDTLCQQSINKFNNIVDDILKYCNRISQYNDVIKDLRCYIDDNGMDSFDNILIKFEFNKNGNPFCLMCNFGNSKIDKIEGLKVEIFYGKFHMKKDYSSGKGFLELGVCTYDLHPSIEITAIDIRIKGKRLGIGTSALKWLEKIIVPELNRRIDKFNDEYKSEEDDFKLYHIEKVYGCSGDLSSDTDSEARKRFYTKNGYIMNGDIFTKVLCTRSKMKFSNNR